MGRYSEMLLIVIIFVGAGMHWFSKYYVPATTEGVVAAVIMGGLCGFFLFFVSFITYALSRR